MRKMNIHTNQRGGSAALLFAFVFVVLLLFGAIVFGIWAYMGVQDYKANMEPKVAAAVEVAKKEISTTKDNELAEREKSPLKRYSGSATYGSVGISYPKTWSAYVDESGTGDSSNPLNGYFHPNFVPGVQESSSFALRVQVVPTSYSEELKQFDSLVTEGKVKISAYSAPKVAGIVGVRVDGQIINEKKGSMVLFPLRDKTLKVWTEADQFVGDFNNSVLPNLTFIP